MLKNVIWTYANVEYSCTSDGINRKAPELLTIAGVQARLVWKMQAKSRDVSTYSAYRWRFE